MKVSKQSIETAAKTTIYGGGSVNTSDVRIPRIPKDKPKQVYLEVKDDIVRWTLTTPVGNKANSGMLKDGPLDKKGWDIWYKLIHTEGSMFHYLTGDPSLGRR